MVRNPAAGTKGKIGKEEMSWKKNAFSYLMWFAYTLITGSALMGLACLLCEERGLAAYWGVVFAALYAVIAAVAVALVCRAVRRASSFLEKNRTLFLVLEASWAVAFLAVGLALRVRGIDSAGQSAAYYEAAKVTMGQEIPQIAHGAVYFYVLALHGVLALFGNHFAAGVWLQIVLQMAAFVLLYFTVRRLAGGVAALVMLGFGMCAPYMVQGALTLSPEMLFFFLCAGALALMTAGNGGGVAPVLFFFTGALASLCCYLDIGGCLLFFPAFGFLFCVRGEEPERWKKAVSALLCLAGAGAGFLGCVLLDALLCGESVGDVAGIWFYLYRPEGFRIPAAAGEPGPGAQGVLLTGLMALGIFSFWCDRKRERMAVWASAAGCAVLAGCFGIFTEEMPGYFAVYLLSAVLAGVGAGQCFYWGELEKAERVDGAEDADSIDSAGRADGAEDVPGMDGGAVGALAGAAAVVQDARMGLAGAAAAVQDARMGLAGAAAVVQDARTGLAGVAAQDVRTGLAGAVAQDVRMGAAGVAAVAQDVRMGAAGVAAAAQAFREESDIHEVMAFQEEDVFAARVSRKEEEMPVAQPSPQQTEDAPVEPLSSAEAPKKTIKYIENPLPLPKKHVKRVLDFPLNSVEENGEFDYAVSEEDDFDI